MSVYRTLPFISNGKTFPPGSAAGSRHRHSMTRRLAITKAAFIFLSRASQATIAIQRPSGTDGCRGG